MTGSDVPGIGEHGPYDFPGLPEDDQLIILRKKIEGDVVDAPESAPFKFIKAFVGFATRVHPKFFGYFTEGLDDRPQNHSGEG